VAGGRHLHPCQRLFGFSEQHGCRPDSVDSAEPWSTRLLASLQEANQNPNTACGGTAAEMVYPGGELAFILRMLEDSVRLGGRVHW
jgi:23S rRNA A1618 N6-methylase RlmF